MVSNEYLNLFFDNIYYEIFMEKKMLLFSIALAIYIPLMIYYYYFYIYKDIKTVNNFDIVNENCNTCSGCFPIENNINIRIIKEFIECVGSTERDCPWTKDLKVEQVLEYLEAEVEEVQRACKEKDINNIKEEIGDVMWNLLLLAIVFKKNGEPRLIHDSMINSINKMKGRYTWVSFPGQPATENAKTSEDVEKLWNKRHDDKYGKKERIERDIEITNQKLEKLNTKFRIINAKIGKFKNRLVDKKGELSEILEKEKL
jgi:NTP pyrophosphatase (non-canonical NTP hydrolase)